MNKSKKLQFALKKQDEHYVYANNAKIAVL